MIIRKILKRASGIAYSLSHFGRLGKVAATRSFLRKERKKLLLKLGESSMHWLERHPESSPDLQRVVAQIHKIDALLSSKDYGGEKGVEFGEASAGIAPRKPARKLKTHSSG